MSPSQTSLGGATIKHHIAATCFAVLAILLAGPVASAGAQTVNDPAEVRAAIRYHFPWYEEDAALAVARCETRMGRDILNDYSGAYGAFQFIPSTSYAMGFDHGAMSSPWYAAWAAARLQNQYGWGQWSCSYLL